MAKVNLSDLSALLDIQTTASQTKLRKIKEREQKLRDMLSLLLRSKEDVATDGDRANSVTVDYQNDLQHLRWVDQRRAAINIELAQVKALIDMATRDLSIHVARQNALETAAEKQNIAAATLKKRRSDYGS